MLDYLLELDSSIRLIDLPKPRHIASTPTVQLVLRNRKPVLIITPSSSMPSCAKIIKTNPRTAKTQNHPASSNFDHPSLSLLSTSPFFLTPNYASYLAIPASPQALLNSPTIALPFVLLVSRPNGSFSKFSSLASQRARCEGAASTSSRFCSVHCVLCGWLGAGRRLFDPYQWDREEIQ